VHCAVLCRVSPASSTKRLCLVRSEGAMFESAREESLFKSSDQPQSSECNPAQHSSVPEYPAEKPPYHPTGFASVSFRSPYQKISPSRPEKQILVNCCRPKLAVFRTLEWSCHGPAFAKVFASNGRTACVAGVMKNSGPRRPIGLKNQTHRCGQYLLHRLDLMSASGSAAADADHRWVCRLSSLHITCNGLQLAALL